MLLHERRSPAVSGSGLKRIASATATLPMSCSRKPNSTWGSSASCRPAAARELLPVSGDALGVLAGVGIRRLDRVRERADGGDVRGAQLLRPAPLPFEGLAQVGRVALELAFLLCCQRGLFCQRRAQRGDLLVPRVSNDLSHRLNRPHRCGRTLRLVAC